MSFFSGILITPQGASWPATLGTQQEMSSGGEPPTAATESGKLLSPQLEGKVRATGLIQAAFRLTELQWEVSEIHVTQQHRCALMWLTEITAWLQTRATRVSKGSVKLYRFIHQ